MPSAPGSPSPQSQPANTRKSILTRLSSPFASKSRTVTDFIVQADDPHRKYSPGDVVKGSVILKLAKPVRVTHIVICLHGFVQVYKTPGVAPPDGFRAHNNHMGKRRGNRRGEYFGNGFATLFEDEQVICGDGRLEEGNYRFEFHTKFPDETLPSSIEFERGTISYMVTATMTRPTSMTPVVYHDQKITFAERIDIAKLLPPKPRTISLEPLLKRSGKSSSKKQTGSDETTRRDAASAADNRTPPRSRANAGEDSGAPRSPSPSVRSAVSLQSMTPAASVSGSGLRSSRASDNGSVTMRGSQKDSSGRVISATVESMRGGTLRGDTVPLRVSITHLKYVKSMHGVIVTLYRQARVDTHPSLPIGPTTDGEKRKFEDYYPKSLTGLGGLSLSGAGSSHMFRKDLAQIALPLIVDPVTLSAELHPKLRVPEDAFPTIACVPGAMISFKYYLEVVIDIQGKRGSSDRYFPLSGSTYQEGSSNIDAQSSHSSDRLNASVPLRYIDTAAIRRDKSVVSCILEIVVGTVDSERKKDKQPALTEQQMERHNSERQRPVALQQGVARQDREWYGYEGHREGQSVPNEHGEQGDYGHGYDEGYDYSYEDQYQGQYEDQYYWQYPENAGMEFEPPTPSFDESVPEKERLRRAEAALLPSEPPGVNGGQDSSPINVPSASMIDEEYGAIVAGPARPPHSQSDPGRMIDPQAAQDSDLPQVPRYSSITWADASGSASSVLPALAGQGDGDDRQVARGSEDSTVAGDHCSPDDGQDSAGRHATQERGSEVVDSDDHLPLYQR